MKKFLCLLGLTLALATATYAAPVHDVGSVQSSQIEFTQSESQMVEDFVLVSYDYNTIATATVTESYIIYEAMPMEVRSQVFNLKMPVFRLCINRKSAFKSNIYTGWCGVNKNPPSQYDRA